MPRIDVLELLKNGKSVQIKPQGMSMVPLIYPGRDEVVISPVAGELKKYDIILYRSMKTGLLTLHRIVDIKEDTFFVCGDNQTTLEEINSEQIHGIVTEIYRKGKRIDTNNLFYRTVSKLYTGNKGNISRLRRMIKR